MGIPLLDLTHIFMKGLLLGRSELTLCAVASVRLRILKQFLAMSVITFRYDSFVVSECVLSIVLITKTFKYELQNKQTKCSISIYYTQLVSDAINSEYNSL